VKEESARGYKERVLEGACGKATKLRYGDMVKGRREIIFPKPY
jgi:hypothetical protein